MCGKSIFRTEEEAKQFIKFSSTHKGFYICELSKTYHVTKQSGGKRYKAYGSRRFQFNPRRLMKELQRDMAKKTLSQEIIQYMEGMYTKQKVYKISSKMVTEFIHSTRPTLNRNHIASEISNLKKKKVIVGIDEKVPDQPGAFYFALASVLEEVTKPTDGNIEVTKVPAQKPTPPVANPFDKVFSQLELILTQITGLSKGYTELVQTVNNVEDNNKLHASSQSKLLAHYYETLNGHIGEGIAELVKNQQIIRNDGQSHFEELKEIASSHVTVDGDKLADVINKRLGDFKLEDSFIYRVREEVYERSTTPIDSLHTRLDEIEELWKKFATNESDDYKRGIKDGIRIAVEMGIFIPDGE
jgi:hypothetical protein